MIKAITLLLYIFDFLSDMFYFTYLSYFKMEQNLEKLQSKFLTICTEKDKIIESMVERMQGQEVLIKNLIEEKSSISDDYVKKSVSDLFGQELIFVYDQKKYIMIDVTQLNEQMKFFFPKEVQFSNKFHHNKQKVEVIETKNQCQKILQEIVLLKDLVSKLQEKVNVLQLPSLATQTKKGLSLEERMSYEDRLSNQQSQNKRQSSNYDRSATSGHEYLTFEKRKMDIDNSSDGIVTEKQEKEGFLKNRMKIFQNSLELLDALDSPKRKPKQHLNPDYSTPSKLRPLEPAYPPKDNTPPNEPFEPMRFSQQLNENELPDQSAKIQQLNQKKVSNDASKSILEDSSRTPLSKKHKPSKIIYIRK